MDDSTKPLKAKEHWKQKRSRSTSSLAAIASASLTSVKSDSDSGKEVNDSDEAQRSFAKLSLQAGKPRYGQSRPKNKCMPLTLPTPSMESDSVNELLSPLQNLNSTQQSCRRRRRYKRMAIDYIAEIDTQDDPNRFKEPFPNPAYLSDNPGCSRVELPIPSTSTGISHQNPNYLKKHKKKGSIGTFLPFELDTGKRKRGGKEKSDHSFPLDACSSEFQSMIGLGLDLMNVDMNEDEIMDDNGEDVSSVSSGSQLGPSCDEGREADDEQSDWVGDEWKDEMGETDRRSLLLRRLRDYVPAREIRAGRRRVHPEIPPFSTRTYANEQVSKFLQDPSQSQLRLHPMRQDERVQLSHIASLYSLQLHSDDTGGCPVLIKTSNTTQMMSFSPDRIGVTSLVPLEPSLLESESDSKRIRKADYE